MGLPHFAFEKLEHVSICVGEEVEEIIKIDARLVCLPNLTYLNRYWYESEELLQWAGDL